MEKPVVEIRNAREENAAALLEIYAPYVLGTAVTFEYEVPSEEYFRERIRTISEEWPYIIAEVGGVPVGYAYAHQLRERKAFCHSVETSIYIRDDFHGQGLGRRLYAALEERLRLLGVTNEYAVVAVPDGFPDVREDPYLTTGSVSFHERLGFRIAGDLHRCGTKFGRHYDVLYMEKFI